MASYERSLSILKNAALYNNKITIKTGIMVGLGETKEQVIDLMKDFFSIGGEVITIGQYLPPGKEFLPVVEYIKPDIFRFYEAKGLEIGLKKVVANPFVRSSYHAEKNFIKNN